MQPSLALIAFVGSLAFLFGTVLRSAEDEKKDPEKPKKESPADEPDEKDSPGGHEEEEERPAPPPSANLNLSSDLTDTARAAAEEAIKTYQEAEQAKEGRPKAVRKSLEKLRQASQKAHKSPVPLYWLGRGYQITRNYPEAKRALEKAIKMNPKFHEAVTELARVLVAQKDFKKALGVYEEALSMQPNFLQAVEGKFNALVALGRFPEAKPYLEHAEKIQPSKHRKRLVQALQVEIKGPGWAKTYTAETDDYSVLTSVSQEYAQQIAFHAKMIRRAYDQVFTNIEKPNRKFPIWVYSDREAFLKAGSPPMSAGYYSPLFRKLVLYRNPKLDETLRTLYHEALHQYLHDYLDAAPQWFNEGLGDYFGAYKYAQQSKEKKMLSRPNSGRLRYIQGAINAGITPPASSLMLMSQQEMYNPRMIGVHYCQAWAMVYFMVEGPNPNYKKALMLYFKELTKGKDIQEAYDATFGKINMDRFDKDWKGYIKDLSSGSN